MSTTPLLAIQNVTLRYGQLTAVDSVSLTVPRGGRHALIGPNGAGKSSLFSVLAGAVPATSGRITFNRNDVSAEDEILRSRRGLVRTYQHANLFVGLSVLENVCVPVERLHGAPLRPWPTRSSCSVRAKALEFIESVGLAERASDPVASLSHGERRQLEVAMVLACEPSMILFDEPTAGMSAAETHAFGDLVESLPSSVATVIVEHDLDVVFRLAEHVHVLAAGRLIAEGRPEDVRSDPAVLEAYLGANRGQEPLFTESS